MSQKKEQLKQSYATLTSGKEKLAAAKNRLAKAKELTGEEALTPEAIAEKETTINNVATKLKALEASIAKGKEIIKQGKEKLELIYPKKQG
ncbi:hypothetical protein [Aquimarina hainanensis]|uniref:hypothetical protein n=1 Tax=Aquimarina hainanensis TaxID=1578017 RepID=UPI00361FEDE8